MSSFSVKKRKTPFQKHKEEEEAKKRREEDETARLYAEFVESFQDDTAPGSNIFIRGGTINPNDKIEKDSEGGNSKDGVSGSKKGSRYVPSFVPPPMATKGKDCENKDERVKEKEKGKSRNIDLLMDELNKEREHRRDGLRIDNSCLSSRFDELPDDFDLSNKPGSFDDGDPQTTNLYVGNLAPQAEVNENFLLRTFGRFGPIASVKIMWPRTEEEHRRERKSGFVAFINRADGQAAKDEMQGMVVFGYELKIGWGKSVSLPSQALPAPPPGHMAIRSKEGATVILSGPSGALVSSVPSQNSELVLTPDVPDITVAPPKDDHLRHVIDTMALYVLDGGCSFEEAIMERGRGNPLFSFLFDSGSKEHAYYVWRLYSFAQGDTLQRWRTDPFIMITGRARWIPPSAPVAKSPEHIESGSTYAAGRSRPERKQHTELERTLTDAQRDDFEDMLRALTLERSQIMEAMSFALDNADAAGEIVEVLTESLTLKDTPIPTKVARLMLVSDILHNSSAPVKNASVYHTKFELALPDIVESFNDLYHSISGRITAEALKERVLKVLQVWADWFLFSDAYVNGLRATFLRSRSCGVIPFHSICGAAPDLEKKVSSGETSDALNNYQDAALAMGKGASTNELLNLPLGELERRCRQNGLSLVGSRESMVARLLYLEEAEKQRGYELNDDLKYAQRPRTHLNSVRYTGGQKETKTEMKSAGLSALNSNREDDIQLLGKGSGQLAPTNPIPQPESRALTDTEKCEPMLTASKWGRDDNESDDELKTNTKDLKLTYPFSGSENACEIPKCVEMDLAIDASVPVHPNSVINKEQRQKLRLLEVALIEYRDSLKDEGVKDVGKIETKFLLHRKHLESELGVVHSNENTLINKRGTSDRIERREESHESSRKRNHSPGESKNPQRNFSANKFTIAIRVGSNPLVRILVSVLKGYITIEKV